MRDLYLSHKSRSRRSCFAFVRFATREEAERVVKQTNGMHVYGWPIISKIASSDWNNRRKLQEVFNKRVHSIPSRSSEGKMSNRGFNNTKTPAGPSFAEVVKMTIKDPNTSGIKVKDSMDGEEIMKWDVNIHDSSWLKLCAVGVLKSFSDIIPVLRGLGERRIEVSTFYLGDKNILWSFMSISDRDTFISSRVLWEDYFSSVGVWTDAITPQSRISWIEFRGIPLHCWCDEFFKSLGWMVGEPLIVEEETSNRTKLDCGRVLVLIPAGQRCPGLIKVVTGSGSFPIKVWEDSNRINSDWISKRLGIGKWKFFEFSPMGRHNMEAVKRLEEDDRVDNLNTREVVANYDPNNQNMADIETRGTGDVQNNNVSAIGGSAGFNDANRIGHLERQKDAGAGSKKVLFKGKGIICKSMNQRQKVPLTINDNLVLDKNGDSDVGRVWSSDDCGSSTFEEREEGQLLKQPIIIGEPSKIELGILKGGNIVIDLGNGLGQEKNPQDSCYHLTASPNRISGQKSNEAHIELLEKAQSNQRKIQCQEVLSEEQKSSSGNSVSHISETLFHQSAIIEEHRILSTGRERKKNSSKKIAKSCSSIKSHSMKTRKDKSQLVRGVQEITKETEVTRCSRGRWNLEEELAKVLEKGVALGYFNRSLHSHKSGTGISEGGIAKTGAWNLSDEVAKVIETRIALGLDFQGKEDLAVVEICRKEREEALRINEAK